MYISHILKWINELRLDLRRGTTLRCTELRHQLTIGCRARASTATLLTQWSATSLSGSVPLVTALSIVLASNAHSGARERIWGVALDALPFDAILWDGRVQLIIIPERHASVTIASGSSERASFPVLETLAFVELAGGLIETPDPNPENTQIKDEPTDRQRSAQARCFALFKWGNDFWLDALMQDAQYWQRSRQKKNGNSFTQDTQRISPNILKSQVLEQPHEPSPPPLAAWRAAAVVWGKKIKTEKSALLCRDLPGHTQLSTAWTNPPYIPQDSPQQEKQELRPMCPLFKLFDYMCLFKVLPFWVGFFGTQQPVQIIQIPCGC